MSVKNPAILTSKEEIQEYLGVGRTVVEKFASMGMPVVKIDGQWFSHGEYIEGWYKTLIRKYLKTPPPASQQ